MLVFKGQFTYSLANIHGDVFATINGVGGLIATHLTGPFGEQVSGQTTPGNTLSGATYNWVGTNEKLTESDMTLQPTQMGARVYLASIGRFLQVDPQEGGTDNAYAYANDPVNDFDLDGTAINWRAIGKIAVAVAAVGAAVACGVSVVCGIAVGAAAGAAAYAVAKGGTKEFSARGLAGATLVGGLTGGIAAKVNIGAAIGKVGASLAKKVAPGTFRAVTGFTDHGLKRVMGSRGDGGMSDAAIANIVRTGARSIRWANLSIQHRTDGGYVSLNVLGKIVSAGVKKNAAGRLLRRY